MPTFQEFINTAQQYSHHALLLVTKNTEKNWLQKFTQLANKLCNINLNLAHDTQTTLIEHPDIFIADRERKTLRLDDLRKINELCLYPPTAASRRLIYIENCARMNINAANALLKSLEEPASQVLFVLTTPHLNLVLPTISSRCCKIFINSNQDAAADPLQQLEQEHSNWLRQQANTWQQNNYFLGNSFSEHLSAKVTAQTMREIIKFADTVGKKYSADILRASLVLLVNEKVKAQPEFLDMARMVLNNISTWKNQEPLHPSSSLWLSKILIGLQLKK